LAVVAMNAGARTEMKPSGKILDMSDISGMLCAWVVIIEDQAVSVVWEQAICTSKWYQLSIYT